MSMTWKEYDDCLMKNIEPNFREIAEDYISYEKEIDEFWATNPSKYKQKKWSEMMDNKHNYFAYSFLQHDYSSDGWLRWDEYVNGSVLANRKTEWMKKLQKTIQILKIGSKE